MNLAAFFDIRMIPTNLEPSSNSTGYHLSRKPARNEIATIVETCVQEYVLVCREDIIRGTHHAYGDCTSIRVPELQKLSDASSLALCM